MTSGPTVVRIDKKHTCQSCARWDLLLLPRNSVVFGDQNVPALSDNDKPVINDLAIKQQGFFCKRHDLTFNRQDVAGSAWE
jgi:hypothetical protein